jgi:MinD-like ATPase involved in chromosome partitioning or flagellar assembly
VTTISLCSAKGSPGVTTLACALAAVWYSERRVVIAECDPFGGDLAPRFGLSTRRGMTSLVLSRRHELSDVSNPDDHTQRLPGGLEVLAGPVGSDSASALDEELPSVLSHLLPTDSDVLVDCGRFVPGAGGQLRFLRESDVVVVVTRADASGLTHTRWLIEKMRAHGMNESLRLVIVGDCIFPPREISEALGIGILEVMPTDSKAAAIVSGMPGHVHTLARSSLVSCAKRIVQRLCVEGCQQLPRGPTTGPADPKAAPSAKPGTSTNPPEHKPPGSRNGSRADASVS